MPKTNKKTKNVTLKCGCNCCMLVAERTEWEDGEINFDISMQDSRYDHNNGSILNRIKNALKILFGKPVYYNDIFIEGEEGYRKLVKDMEKLLDPITEKQ